MVGSDDLIGRIEARLLRRPEAGVESEMKPDWQPDVPFDRPPVEAAVLIGIVKRPSGLSVLYTERSPELRSRNFLSRAQTDSPEEGIEVSQVGTSNQGVLHGQPYKPVEPWVTDHKPAKPSLQVIARPCRQVTPEPLDVVDEGARRASFRIARIDQSAERHVVVVGGNRTELAHS